MRKTSLGILLAASLFSASAFADKPLATVNGTVIPQSRLDDLVKQLSSQNPKLTLDAPLKARIKENLIANEVVRQEAIRKGLEQDPTYLARLAQVKAELLTGSLIESFFKQYPVTEAEAKKEYDKISVNLSGKEYRVRHILVDNEAKAKELLAELKKGAKFETLAQTHSKDSGSAKKGGELDWSVPENYTPAFAQAIKRMPKGKISEEPVKTEFGWHIIKIDDIRIRKGPSFAEVKNAVIQQIQAEQLKKYVAELVAKAKITQ